MNTSEFLEDQTVSTMYSDLERFETGTLLTDATQRFRKKTHLIGCSFTGLLVWLLRQAKSKLGLWEWKERTLFMAVTIDGSEWEIQKELTQLLGRSQEI